MASIVICRLVVSETVHSSDPDWARPGRIPPMRLGSVFDLIYSVGPVDFPVIPDPSFSAFY